MKKICPRCGNEQQLVEGAPRVLLHALPELRSPAEVTVPFTCPMCGCEVRTSFRYVPTDRTVAPPPAAEQREPDIKRQIGQIHGLGGTFTTFLQYPGVALAGGNALFPAHEGSLGTGRAIGPHGNPDLMAEFSSEYLRQYQAIFPKDRLPRTVSELMPPLHLLVSAAELALKADLIRADRKSDGHSLRTLYKSLDGEHRREIERRFAVAGPNADLRAMGVETPTVESVLDVYGPSFGGSTVYQDTRYFAEPTTKLRSDELRGGNLVKTAPYPIFLPVLVQTLIDVYVFFSGEERLTRLGADVARESRDPGKDNHGDWGFVPSSVGLGVVRVAQFVARDERGTDRAVFRRFTAAHPPGFSTSSGYGGNVLLFYGTANTHPEDGETVIDGLECKVWYHGRLGMHPRDLYLLADALESEDGLESFPWPNPPGD